MKRIIAFIGVQIIAFFFGISSLYAWTGDTWGPISRETIIRMAGEMVDFSWSPKNTISNWNYGSVWKTYYVGNPYRGEAYSQMNDQQNWAEFYSAANNVSGGSYYLGNDCSGFVSISWRLPTRYTTADFEYDATHDGGYVTSLGEKSDGLQKAEGLLTGDALVSTSKGHIILFVGYLPDGSGINAIEQTPDSAVRTDKYSWVRLSSYRPIRRNKVDEGNYVAIPNWGPQTSLRPRGVAVDSSGNVYVTNDFQGSPPRPEV